MVAYRYAIQHKLLSAHSDPLKMGRVSMNDALAACENKKRQSDDNTTDGGHARRPDYEDVWEASGNPEDSLSGESNIEEDNLVS